MNWHFMKTINIKPGWLNLIIMNWIELEFNEIKINWILFGFNWPCLLSVQNDFRVFKVVLYIECVMDSSICCFWLSVHFRASGSTGMNEVERIFTLNWCSGIRHEAVRGWSGGGPDSRTERLKFRVKIYHLLRNLSKKKVRTANVHFFAIYLPC